jgi:hypothetical protein
VRYQPVNTFGASSLITKASVDMNGALAKICGTEETTVKTFTSDVNVALMRLEIRRTLLQVLNWTSFHLTTS